MLNVISVEAVADCTRSKTTAQAAESTPQNQDRNSTG